MRSEQIEQQNNKRIAKNTLLLYFRMLLTMGVSLYTSRVVLQTLGVEDFGIYNVVGGVVAMFALLSGSLSAAISRFLTFELGKNDLEKVKSVFSSAVTIQLFLSIIIVVIAESLGLWFLNYKMNIPLERMAAANWVLQLSILTFCINLVSVPYNAAIIAHERMRAFAYVSILEAVGKLAIAWGIVLSPIDKLKFYAILMCCVALLIRFVYGWFCKRHFEECNYHFVFDKKILRQMFGFAGWNFIGASSVILRDQGGNILLNLFCGPAVNAARGIAFQTQNAIHQFTTSFMTALNPQITKNYANGNHDYMMTLIFQGARLSFYMLLLLSLPILMNTEFILLIWLKNVPDYAVLFTQLIIFFVMSEAISSPLITAMLATGNIRNYQIVVGGIQLMNFPISYILLKMNFGPEIVFIVAVIVSQVCLGARLVMLNRMIELDVVKFLKSVYVNILGVSCLSFLPVFSLKKIGVHCEDLLSFILLSGICFVWSVIVVLFVGCDAKERQMIYKKALAAKQKVLKK